MEEPRRLGNRYELGAVLGRGGMAEVYMARDIRLGRAVAVKTLRADMARDATFQARFRREAQSAASLNHPAIVAVYDTGEDYIGGVSLPFIVMEYVDGSTLRDLLHSGRKLLPERSLEITGGVLQALDYSHRNGIVHRDIKPANVMLTRGGAVKVMDFGIARAMGDAGITMTQTAAVIGTAQYLSPEQAKGEQVDARSDLYSTGCLLYELLTGRPPFVGDSPVAVAYQHVREAPQPPSVYDPEVPPVVDAIVMKSLAKHPDDRYQSADEMRADLERALDGRPVAAAPTVAAGFGATAAPTQVMAPGGRGYGAAAGAGAAAGYNSGGRYGQAPTGYQQPEYEDATPPDYQSPRRTTQGGSGQGGRGKKGNDKTGWVIIGVVVLILVVLAVFVFKTVFSGSTGTTGQVPSIINMTKTQAQTTLSQSKYTLGTSDCGAGQNSDTVKAGTIVSQNPAAGASASTDTPITYCLSLGPQTVGVPKTVSGATGDAVKQVLTEGGFTNVVEKTVTNSAAAGTAMDIQNASGQSVLGQQLPLDTPLTVVVSGGPGTVTMPSVINTNCAAAKQVLTSAPYNFQVTETDSYSQDGTAADMVDSTSPGANATATPGQQVTMVCSQGPAPNPGNGNGNGNGATPSTSANPSGTAATPSSTATDPFGGLGGGNN